jgi:superfamily II DNA or RNA helicase
MPEIPPLRPYQAAAVEHVRAQLAAGTPLRITAAPTGAGKNQPPRENR